MLTNGFTLRVVDEGSYPNVGKTVHIGANGGFTLYDSAPTRLKPTAI